MSKSARFVGDRVKPCFVRFRNTGQSATLRDKLERKAVSLGGKAA
ncbi:hypothetical protein [Burkholderia multivorans]|nr:hypothetical protein [Burkholderia multivorans]